MKMKTKEPKRYNKKLTYVAPNVGRFRCYISLEEALAKVYEVKGYLINQNRMDASGHKRPPTRAACLNVPSILIGHKVKLVLVE